MHAIPWFPSAKKHASSTKALRSRGGNTQVYEQLVAEGRLQEKLVEMYGWGRAHGWDSVYVTDTTVSRPAH